MASCEFTTGLTCPVCSPPEAANFALESASEVSGVALNIMGLIGMLNLSLVNLLFKSPDPVPNGDNFMIGSWVLGGINSLYYAMQGDQNKESSIANKPKELSFKKMSNYLIEKYVYVQPPLITCALAFRFLSGELFQSLSATCFAVSFFTGIGSSLYAVGNAAVYDITKLASLNGN